MVNSLTLSSMTLITMSTKELDQFQIIKNNGEYLIVFKSDTEEISPNEVDIPGGRVEFGEEVEAGLKRKIKEELGIEIDVKNPSRVWGFVKENLHLIGITFL